MDVITDYKQGKTVESLASKYSLNVKTVRSILKEHDIPIRKAKYNLLGKRFGKLMVAKHIGSDNNQKLLWSCHCECGNTAVVRTSDLTSGKQTSCGCVKDALGSERLKQYRHSVKSSGSHFHNWKGCGDIPGKIFSHIKASALTRDLEFAVSDEYLWDLFKAQDGLCNLTGVTLTFKDPWTASLDRIDSSIGYIQGNLQWVHKTVNKMKLDLPESQFIEFCRLVIQHHESKTCRLSLSI